MMQAMQMQYSAAPQSTHQYYGGRGYYGINESYRGQGGRGVQCRENCRGGSGDLGYSDITHYFCTHGMCIHPGTDCRTPAEDQNKNAVWCNKMSGSERNCT